jgi:hypothetical protein
VDTTDPSGTLHGSHSILDGTLGVVSGHSACMCDVYDTWKGIYPPGYTHFSIRASYKMTGSYHSLCEKS